MSARDGAADAAEARLAAEPLAAEDLALLDAVRATWEAHDPVPEGLAGRIEFALTLDALHAEVATLTQLDLAASGARASETEAVRTVTFTAESLVTMVTLASQPDGTVRVDGWIAPGAGLRVEVLLASATLETEADEDGRFVFESVPRGLAKFALHDGEHTVLTPTIEL